MTSAEKVAQLRALLCDTLLPLINNDCIYNRLLLNIL